MNRSAALAPDTLESLTLADGGVCAGRYRLQSSSFEALWLIAEELCRRLKVYFAGDTGEGEGPFEVKFEETLPLQDFFMLIDAHFNVRLALIAPQLVCRCAARVFADSERAAEELVIRRRGASLLPRRSGWGSGPTSSEACRSGCW
jgi:hypothetical protein